MIGQAFHWANLALAFLLELCALGALGYWGVRTGGGPVAKRAGWLPPRRGFDRDLTVTGANIGKQWET
jgi:hypothetical protein